MAEYNWYNPMTWDMQNNPAYRAGQSYYDLTRGENAPPEADNPWALAQDIGPLYTKFINDKLKGFNYPTPNLTMPNNILENLGNIFRKKDPPYDDYNADRFSNLNNLATDTYPNTGAQFTEDTDPYSQAKKNFINNQFRMRDTNALTHQGDYTQGGQKVSETGGAESTGFQFPNIGITGILQGIKDQFEYKGAQGEAWDPNTGQMISAEEQDKQNALGGYYSEAARYDRRQRKRVTDMLARQKAGKKIGDTNLKRLLELGYGPEKVITETVTDVTRPGGGYTGPKTQDFNPQQFARAGRRPDRPGGFTDPGRGSYGPHKADGGRIGYAFAGPVGVEQQTDFIEGPQGANEFQETVVEGQQQPSREQLEALAMKIFQLPLDDLDDQQLVVVYQEAMRGQPMEEAFQAEDVQFAANGGLAGLL